MAVEMDSREYHSGARYAATVARHRRLASYGVVVCSIVPISSGPTRTRSSPR